MPASQPKPATPGAKRTNKREGPNPMHVLLASIRNAVAAEVPAAQIIPILDMAMSSSGASQAPAFRMCATTLDTYAKAAKPATPTEPTSA